MKLKPMSNFTFRLMNWLFDLSDGYLHLWINPEELVMRVPLKKGMTVVDYACGPGRYTIPIAKILGLQGTAYAVDIQPLAIEIVKKKAAANSLTNIKTILIDSYDTGIPGSTVDLVLLIDAIQGIKEYDMLFHEVHRMLKPDGRFFLDSGHLKVSKVGSMVESTGLFDVIKLDGKNMLLKKRAG
jgi:ubiquinone/menaquinone biosynthesis C-methylase UbiE